jgi:hypothetical protein
MRYTYYNNAMTGVIFSVYENKAQLNKKRRQKHATFVNNFFSFL